jgi:hypothetical protein
LSVREKSVERCKVTMDLAAVPMLKRRL